jgi:hypothetical protein
MSGSGILPGVVLEHCLKNKEKKMYIVKYEGPFGFIKPWTAVRDAGVSSFTFSQQFLTPSIIEGIRQKLEVKEILRHRLTYSSMSLQLETVHPKDYTVNKKNSTMSREKAVIKRGLLIDPVLYLAFSNYPYALKASKEHVCLCRNEDILLPSEEILELPEEEFDKLQGFELQFGNGNNSFIVGFDRFNSSSPMYGSLHICGNPIRNKAEEE